MYRNWSSNMDRGRNQRSRGRRPHLLQFVESDALTPPRPEGLMNQTLPHVVVRDNLEDEWNK